MIIGLSGLAGSGKDTVADCLVKHRNAWKISLADPMKRFCAEIFQWDDERLWGPSAFRNAIDPDRKRQDGEYLTPRHALQTLGTEWGRSCYEDVWVDYAVRRANLSMKISPFEHVVIPDIRYQNEVRAVRRAGGAIWRVVRPGAGLTGKAALHVSETSIQDADCDILLLNDKTIPDLEKVVKGIVLE